jgi:four helix bundle protein
MVTSFKDLEVYKDSYELAILINREVNKLPFIEKNDLGSQLRRASKSIPANIAEGWAKRRFIKEFQLHLDISLGSADEMEAHLGLARDLAYWGKEFCNNLIN